MTTQRSSRRIKAKRQDPVQQEATPSPDFLPTQGPTHKRRILEPSSSHWFSDSSLSPCDRSALSKCSDEVRQEILSHVVAAFNMLQNNEPDVTDLMKRAIELLVQINGGEPATRYQACVIEALAKNEISDTNESLSLIHI